VLPAVVFWGGGSHDAPVSGGVIVLVVLALLVVAPAVVGLLLRRRDASRGRSEGDTGRRDPPPRSGRLFSWDASGPFDPWAEATRHDWFVVGALAVGLVLVLLLMRV
jgi:uncharacterized membrane protein YdfJ with MMPL/SSD domain